MEGNPMTNVFSARAVQLALVGAIVVLAGIVHPTPAAAYNVCHDPGAPCVHEDMAKYAQEIYLHSHRQSPDLGGGIRGHLEELRSGAGHEDVFDHVFGHEIEPFFEDAFVTITHFWDADRGPDDRVEIIGGLVDYPNAWQKARSLWSMALGAYADGHEDKAYELLGHVAHLIGDMTVPTHAHDDTHVDFHDDDPYEEWMSGDGEGARAVPPMFPAELDELKELGPLPIPADQPDKLEWLMYTTSQVADFFPSMDVEGDLVDPKGWARAELDALDRLVTSPRTIADLEDNDDGNDDDGGDLSVIREHSYLRGIRAIAALYDLFETTVSRRVNLVVVFDRLEEDEDHDLGPPPDGHPDYWTQAWIGGRWAQNRGDRVRNDNDLVDPDFVFAQPVDVTGHTSVELGVMDWDGWVGNPFRLEELVDQDDRSDIDPDGEDDDETLNLDVDLAKCLRREPGAITGDIGGRCGDQLITGGDDDSEATKVYFRVVMSKSPPIADAGGPYATDEGTDVRLDGGGSSDPDNDIEHYRWDLDKDGECDDAFGKTPLFDRVGHDELTTVRLCVTDKAGLTAEDTAVVTVKNVAPTVGTITANSPRGENAAVSISGAITDPGWEDPLHATIDFGDGSGQRALAGIQEHLRPDGSLTYDLSHAYGDDGTFTIKVCAADDDVSNICTTAQVTVDNVDPTATIGKDAATDINGTSVIIGHAGEAVAFDGRSTDPGSDDLTLVWNWGDGDPAVDASTEYLVNPPFADPDPSPSVQPRDVTETRSFAFGQACLYDVVFSSLDDDSGSASDTVKVLITGNGDDGKTTGYWARQYRQESRVDFDDATLTCYLEIAAFASRVFNEVRDASTFEAAQAVLFSQIKPVTKRDLLDRNLLAAWLNFANGAVAWHEQVDTNGNGTPDTLFAAAMRTAESVRRDPNASPAQIDAQRAIVQSVNDTI
jgi:PKD domain